MSEVEASRRGRNAGRKQSSLEEIVEVRPRKGGGTIVIGRSWRKTVASELSNARDMVSRRLGARALSVVIEELRKSSNWLTGRL